MDKKGKVDESHRSKSPRSGGLKIVTQTVHRIIRPISIVLYIISYIVLPQVCDFDIYLLSKFYNVFHFSIYYGGINFIFYTLNQKIE
jgi:hypothetical protein